MAAGKKNSEVAEKPLRTKGKGPRGSDYLVNVGACAGRLSVGCRLFSRVLADCRLRREEGD